MKTLQSRIARTLAVAAAILALDQATKLAVRHAFDACATTPVSACEQFTIAGPLRLIRLENAGSSFGFLQGFWIWAPVAAAGLVLIHGYGARLGDRGWIAPLALGLQAGGALGNLVDRVLFGSVTDFIDIGVTIVFNVADVSLVLGMGVAVIALSHAIGQDASPHSLPAEGAS
jgi:signal peptidase II